MIQMKFSKQLYSKVALIKAAYNFTDVAYIHLDADEKYFYVSIEQKQPDKKVNKQDFINEMLTQSVRHEVYLQTKNIRELLLARAMASSVITAESLDEIGSDEGTFSEDEILKDWFSENEEIKCQTGNIC